ncbi:MAG: exodeoxyribonuclease III [Nevskiales bacterium]
MRVISFNANGIRAAARKGFFEWLPGQNADVVCIQETKAQLHQLENDPQFFPEGYHCHYFDATARKGYAGTALYSRVEPDEVVIGMDHEEFDAEGRYLEARFGDLRIASLYAPSGSSGDHRQESKERYMLHFLPFLAGRARLAGECLVCGDYNIAHKEIDLKNWKSNQKNSGFLPHEREWMTQLFDTTGYVDVQRALTDEAIYTWWSNRGRARENNVGWRIDYHAATPGLAAKAKTQSVYTDSWFSDHAPLIIDYDYAL